MNQPYPTTEAIKRRGLDWPRLLHLLVLAVSMIWIAGYFFPPINHDTAVLLYISKVWLGGGKLYVDAIDMNTPLVFVLHLLPEAIASVTGLPGTTVLIALLGLGIAASFVTCRWVLAASLDPAHATADALLPLLLLFLLIVYPNDMFSQREHIMLVLTMPYLLVASGRADGETLSNRLKIATGLMAGFGFAMKPYFLGIPLFVELYVASQLTLRRSLADPAPWSVFAVCVAHALFAIIVTPEYFTVALPLARSFYSEVSQNSIFDLILSANLGPPTAILPLLAVAAFLAMRSHLARVICLAGIGGLLSGYAQGKGWSYHALPAQAFTLLLAGVIIAHVMDHVVWPKRGDNRPAKLFAAALMLLIFYQEGLHSRPFSKQLEYGDSDLRRLMHAVKQEKRNDRILVLSPGIYPHFPMLNYLNMRMTMRFESMWMVQGAYAGCQELAPLYNPPEAMSAAEGFVFRSVAEDFYKKKPSLLVIDNVAGIPRCQGDTFDYLEYFSRNPLFAKRFEDYEKALDLGRYTIYRRREGLK
ncbi:hypothetical protein [Ferrovibrio sp.]|uniref:hypothetical protein n=1 Tax=Ferrovibrio sp. TaxID=1917215 RepID=UPI002636A4DC|nr:hypothetical protein [Ferrovibrio sp.]